MAWPGCSQPNPAGGIALTLRVSVAQQAESLRGPIHTLRHMQPTKAQHAKGERSQRPDVE